MNFFFNKPNVTGIGLGYKIINEIQTHEKSIIVFVNKKVSSNCLCSYEKIPNYFKGIKTDIIESGIIESKSLTDRIRPIQGGYSLGPAGINIAGSYGGLVTDGNSLYILSNSHILSICNQLPMGQPILQPATRDGGFSPNDVVGHLYKNIPIMFKTPTSSPVNYVDCAIAKVPNPNLVSNIIAKIGKPTGIAEFDETLLGKEVQLVGRSSEYLKGKIISILSTMESSMCSKQVLFKKQIISSFGIEPGDSGSLMLTMDNKVVGLAFCGSSSICISNAIPLVLDALEVNIVIN